MKKFIQGKFLLLYIFMIVNNLLFAQLAPIGTKWNYLHYYYPSFNVKPKPLVYMIINDTLIQGRTYSVIPNNVYLYPFLYDLDSNRLYEWHNERHLLFDFNLKQGDSAYFDVPIYFDLISRIFEPRLFKIDSIIIDSVFGNKYKSSIVNENGKMKLYPQMIRKKTMLDFMQYFPSSPMDFISRTPITMADGGIVLCSYEEPGKSINIGAKFYCDTSRFTGIIENLPAKNKIYPNPAQSSFTVQFSEFSQDAQVQVYDLNGRLRLTSKVSDNLIVMNDNGELSSGLYFVKIQNKNQFFSEKILITE
ncbi:MAG: T9SS type A sorting domain-containing protein [Bacteroidota bacterium]|nr:T9SS type A sorting domain-containing protein [Bacteroidota bacterium]